MEKTGKQSKKWLDKKKYVSIADFGCGRDDPLGRVALCLTYSFKYFSHGNLQCLVCDRHTHWQRIKTITLKSSTIGSGGFGRHNCLAAVRVTVFMPFGTAMNYKFNHEMLHLNHAHAIKATATKCTSIVVLVPIFSQNQRFENMAYFTRGVGDIFFLSLATSSTARSRVRRRGVNPYPKTKLAAPKHTSATSKGCEDCSARADCD